MTKKQEHKNPLQRDGTSQEQRSLPALDPANLKLDDRSSEDHIHYASQLAELLNFYEINGKISGNWSGFLASVQGQSEKEWEASAAHSPHVALFLAFLKLYRHSLDHLNQLPARHLDFFYHNVLRLPLKKEEPDKVHVLFELNKNVPEYKIDKNALLQAGKDSEGNPLFYKSEEEVVVNQAQIAHLRSVYNDNGELRYALASNSKDGWGEAFDTPDTAWNLFGHGQLPKVQLGFAVASPVLLLSGGQRSVTFTFSLSGEKKIPETFSETEFLGGFRLYASGEDDWLGAFSAVQAEDKSAVFSKETGGWKLKFKIEVDPSQAAILPYNESVLKEKFNTASPLIKILLSSSSRQILEGLRLDSLKVSVSVSNLTNFVVENDLGPLDISKPFSPFGPLAGRGANFYVGSEEVFTKNFTDMRLKVKWLGLPDNFSALYKGYPSFDTNKNKINFKASVSVRGKGTWQPPQAETALFPDNPLSTQEVELPKAATPISGRGLIEVKAAVFQQQNLRPVSLQKNVLSNTLTASQAVLRAAPFFRTTLPFISLLPEKKPFSPELKEGFIKLTLLQDFGFNEYNTQSAKIAADIAAGKKTANDLINAPYIPQIESVKLSYKAETDEIPLQSTSTEEEAAAAQFSSRQAQFFHLTPFGHSEEHGFIKQHLDFLFSSEVRLVPHFQQAGELYIGLKNAEPLRIVNLLFQLAEGSADPELPTPQPEWSVLSQNHWKPLNADLILADDTNGLLKSGIIRFYLPKEATKENVLLDSGFHWLRATVARYPTAVCKAIGIHTQAIRAVWENENKANDHLSAALPAGSIKELEAEAGPVKKVIQPYSSFGGRPQESTQAYYVRVSERLRHKKRASAIWDYERLVLEQFPRVHKVKCLNHTGPNGEMVPGQVTLIVIPELRNRNAVDILKPKLSANELLEIRQFVEKRCSKFVKIYAENPDYEEVKVGVWVKFRRGFEAGTYKKQLNEDLIRFLSPWAFKPEADIRFGTTENKSRILFFMEQLLYVDYVERVSLFHTTENGTSADTNEITAAGSRAILVSAQTHTINDI
ncbi:MAG: hypothetical protein U0X91_09380 [Spirosomataceae bacterium]